MTTTSKPRVQKEVNYQDFLDAAQQLQAEGRRPSLDAIRERLGKLSKTTLVAYRARWLAEQEQASHVNVAISDTFQQAILLEIGRATKTLKDQHQTLIEDYKEQVSESQLLNDELNQELETVKQALQALQTTASAKELEFEKRLSGEQALVKQISEQEHVLRQEMKALIQQYETRMHEEVRAHHQAELNAMRANTRAEELEKQLTELKVKYEGNPHKKIG